MGADERDGISAFAAEVSANTDDFQAFVEAGNGYERNLRSIFDSIAGARSRALSVLGLDGTPPPLAAVTTASGTDPFAELLAEASYNTRFVDEIYQALTTDSAIATTGVPHRRSLNWALRAAGFSLDGTDLSLAEDQARIDAVDIRSDLEAVVGLGPVLGAGVEHQNPEIAVFDMGERFSQYLDELSGVDDGRRAFIGRVMVDYGIDIQAGVRRTDPSDVLPERQASTLLTTHGLGMVPDAEVGAVIDELAGRRVQVSDLSLKPALLLLVDALDLDERSVLLSDRGVGVSWNAWQGDSQPIYRHQQLDRIINATMSAPSTSSGGAITAAGQALVDYVLDTYPRIVATSETATLHQGGYGERSPIEINLRATLATALAAPNYGVDQADYEIGVRLGEVDQLLSLSPPTAEFDALWRERELLVALLISERSPESDLLYEGMAQGLSAGDAMRLMHYAASPTLTNDRVRRLRLVYETNAFGQPLPFDQLNMLSVADAVATPLMTELAALQSIQEARYNQRSDVQVQIPLTPKQIDLVSRYSEVARWFHARFAGAYPSGHQAALQHLVDEDLGWVLHDMPEGFEELAAELMAPENAIIWDLMPGAAGNDKFLGVNGTYRPAGKNLLRTSDPEALLVQMALLAKLGPHQAALDIGGDGIVDDDEVDGWLERNRHDPTIPPALIDQVEMGRQHGLGHDDFGWDELAAILGTAGFTAAVVASIVYSGGAATPLWVQAGLVGLAGAEAYASYKADDPVNAAIAGAGGLADLIVAGRLIRETRDAARLIDAPLSVLRPLRDELLAAAQQSDLEAFRHLASEADTLPPHVFIQQYEELLEQQRRLLLDGAPGDRYTPAQVALAIRKTGRKVVPGNQTKIEELLAAIPGRLWQQIVHEPALMRQLAIAEPNELDKAIEAVVLRITPAETVERLRVIRAHEAVSAKSEIDSVADDVASEFGGLVAEAPIKSLNRAIYKVMVDYNGDPTKISDLARNTIIVEPNQIPIVADRLKSATEVQKLTIQAENNQLGFTGYNFKIETDAGITAEIQVNSPDVVYASWAAEDARRALGDELYEQIDRAVTAQGQTGGLGHSFYERYRVYRPNSPEAIAIAAESRAYYARITQIVIEFGGAG